MFSALWKAGGSVCCAVFLLLFFRPTLFNRDVWRVAGRRAVRGWSFALWTAAYFNFALYAWALRFIDVSVAAALYEIHALLVVLALGWLFRRERSYRRITLLSALFFSIAFAGVVCVIAAQAGGAAFFAGSPSTSLPSLAAGIGLMAASSALAVLSAFGFRWAADLASDLGNA